MMRSTPGVIVAWLLATALLCLATFWLGRSTVPPGKAPLTGDVPITPGAAATAASSPRIDRHLAESDEATDEDAEEEPGRISGKALNSTLSMAELHRDYSGQDLPALEASAGDSPAAYLQFLEKQLQWTMHAQAVTSIELGKAYAIKSGNTPEDLFSGAPYMLYSSIKRPGSSFGKVAVPMVDPDGVLAMQRAVSDTRDSIAQTYVAEHNAKPEVERAQIQAAYRAGKGLTGLPDFVHSMIAHRVRWSEVGSLIELRPR